MITTWSTCNWNRKSQAMSGHYLRNGFGGESGWNQVEAEPDSYSNCNSFSCTPIWLSPLQVQWTKRTKHWVLENSLLCLTPYSSFPCKETLKKDNSILTDLFHTHHQNLWKCHTTSLKELSSIVSSWAKQVILNHPDDPSVTIKSW